MIYASCYVNSSRLESQESFVSATQKLEDIKYQIEQFQAQFEAIQSQLDSIESETGINFTERPADWGTETLSDEIQDALRVLEDWAKN